MYRWRYLLLARRKKSDVRERIVLCSCTSAVHINAIEEASQHLLRRNVYRLCTHMRLITLE